MLTKKQSMAVLALFLSGSQATTLKQKMSAFESVINEMREELALDSIQGDLINKDQLTHKVSETNVDHDVKEAIVKEHQAEEEADKIETQLAEANSRREKLRAQKNLKKAELKLKQAQDNLELAKEESIEVDAPATGKQTMAQRQHKADESASESEDEQEERTTMKNYFKQSDIYKKFERDEEKELVKEDECEETDQQLHDMEKKYAQLQKDFSNLQKKMVD